ncbi:MAG: membrane protein insertion efficiency factor YidD [Candidatus Omnitrophica bacterium]|nr:membrane protein insertion efficiency factor YidD [Candidatus Omnitrophota bacterium]MDD5080025.1 membrane protein insertion efficiency factor YidD [Candidatus Omnitrophota bacterium]
MRRLVIALLNFYQQYISRMLPLSCRYWPTCSEYAKQAVGKYGLLRGGLKAAARLLRCHPLSGKSGFDPLN